METPKTETPMAEEDRWLLQYAQQLALQLQLTSQEENSVDIRRIGSKWRGTNILQKSLDRMEKSL